jgi:hypothetical protein
MSKKKKQIPIDNPWDKVYRYEDYNSYTQLPTVQQELRITLNAAGELVAHFTKMEYGSGGGGVGTKSQFSLPVKSTSKEGNYIVLVLSEDMGHTVFENTITVNPKTGSFIPWKPSERVHPWLEATISGTENWFM